MGCSTSVAKRHHLLGTSYADTVPVTQVTCQPDIDTHYRCYASACGAAQKCARHSWNVISELAVRCNRDNSHSHYCPGMFFFTGERFAVTTASIDLPASPKLEVKCKVTRYALYYY
jgi:hypothetical protein